MKAFWVVVSCLLLALSVACSGAPEYPSCENDGHCASHGEFCVNKVCKKCGNDQHCVQTMNHPCGICDAATFTCKKKDGCCSTDADCAGGRCVTQPAQRVGTCQAR